MAWAVYWSVAYRDSGLLTSDGSYIDRLLFHIPELTESLWSALRSALPAVFLHHDTVQLLYVSSLLLLFGVIFEVREGSAKAIAVFFGASFAGTLVAGTLLHLIYPDVLNSPGLASAWERGWGGGSVGCFGLIGAMAARARSPWMLLGFFVVMELCIAGWSLAAFTPVMHFAGLLAGFLIASWWRPG